MSEGAILIAEISKRYFFHPEWKGIFATKTREMNEFFSNDIYARIIESYKKIPDNRISKLGKIRFYLLKNRRYRLLMFAEKINRIRYLWKDRK